MPKLGVAIVGAGLTGLALAIALQKYAPDVDLEIYEGAIELSVLGAGIGLQKRTWAIMQALGLDHALLNISGMEHDQSDQADGVIFRTLMDRERSFTFHRAELQTVFQEHLQSPHKLHLDKRLVSYTQSLDKARHHIQIFFQDGTTATCDILVGCDGVRSGTRAAMYTHLAEAAQVTGEDTQAELRSHILPVFSGSLIYRTLLRKDILTEPVASYPALNNPAMMLYCGKKNRHLVGYPISQGRILNLVAVVSMPEKHIYGALKWSINVVTKLPTFVDGRVVLLGDAVHGMTPHQGAGAGQGFEDAFLLAQFLGRPDVTVKTLPIALRVYDEIRRPFSQNVAALSERSGDLYNLDAPEYSWLTEAQSASGEGITLEQLQEIGEKIERLTDWRLVSSVIEERDFSMRKLDKALYD